MEMKRWLNFISLFCYQIPIKFCSAQLGSKASPVLVEVYYESMCPDSKYFIREQLVPAVQKIPEIINFRLIPYGKATVRTRNK